MSAENHGHLSFATLWMRRDNFPVNVILHVGVIFLFLCLMSVSFEKKFSSMSVMSDIRKHLFFLFGKVFIYVPCVIVFLSILWLLFRRRLFSSFFFSNLAHFVVDHHVADWLTVRLW